MTHSNDPTTDKMNADWLSDCAIACLTNLKILRTKSSPGLRRIANVTSGPDGNTIDCAGAGANVDGVVVVMVTMRKNRFVLSCWLASIFSFPCFVVGSCNKVNDKRKPEQILSCAVHRHCANGQTVAKLSGSVGTHSRRQCTVSVRWPVAEKKLRKEANTWFVFRTVELTVRRRRERSDVDMIKT